MANKFGLDLGDMFENAKDSTDQFTLDDLKEKMVQFGDAIANTASDVSDAAKRKKKEIEDKLSELDNQVKQASEEYNDAYTQMNDKGVRLLTERLRSSDSIDYVENLVNSIANHPKKFDTDFETIKMNRKTFLGTCDFVEKEVQDARDAATRAGAGLAAGATVAFMAPTAAMWVATTFGTASTGAAISTLSGAAASQAALAWLGGGAIAAGGGGVAAGNALLAMAGPIGWSIAGASLFATIIIYSRNKMELDKKKNEEILAIKNNTLEVKKMDFDIAKILNETESVRKGLNDSCMKAMRFYNVEYSTLGSEEKAELGSLVNKTLALSALFDKTVNSGEDNNADE